MLSKQECLCLHDACVCGLRFSNHGRRSVYDHRATVFVFLMEGVARVGDRGSGRLTPAPKIRSWSQKLCGAYVGQVSEYNGSDHLSNFDTLETTCLYSHTA